MFPTPTTHLLFLVEVLMVRSQQILIVHRVALKVALLASHHASRQFRHARVEVFPWECDVLVLLFTLRHELLVEGFRYVRLGDCEALLHYLMIENYVRIWGNLQDCRRTVYTLHTYIHVECVMLLLKVFNFIGKYFSFTFKCCWKCCHEKVFLHFSYTAFKVCFNNKCKTITCLLCLLFISI